MTALRRPNILYDAIILGSDLSGLVAGALLTKRGLRVLVAREGADRKAEGYLLPDAPNLLPSPKAIPAFHAALEELALMPTVGRAIVPHPAGLQLVLPDARLDLFAEEAARKKELRRAFGSQGGGWDDAVQGLELPITTWLEAAALLPAAGIRDRLKLRGPAKKLLKHGEEMDNRLLDALRGLYGVLAPADGGPVGFARTILPLLSQPSRIEGPDLEAALRAFITSSRGEVIERTAVEEVVLSRGRFHGLRFAGMVEPHRGKVGIAACTPHHLAKLLEGNKLQRKVEAEGEKVQGAARLRTLNLVLDEAAIPPGLASATLLHGFSGPTTLLSHEPTRAADGKVAPGLVTLSAAASFSEEAGATAALEAAVEEVVPFFERHVRARGEGDGAPRALQLAEPGSLGLQGLGPETPIGRLLWASSSVLPGIGLEGQVLAGMRAAAEVEALSKKA